MQSPSFYLQQALELAKQRRGFCAPNPAVGAIIVKDGTVLAQGVHFAAGSPHAEIEALSQLAENAKGASLYVTLEPCCHFGKTPPCTKQIIQSGIKEVFFGYSDPHQQVAGQGENELRSAGIVCQSIEVADIAKFYESYAHWLQTKQPWVTGKIAISLDGKIAAQDGSPIAITGHELQKYTHQWRRKSDAILTTVRTIINDDPSLNVRENDHIIAKPLYVIDRDLSLPKNAKVINTAKPLTLFHSKDISLEKVLSIQQLGIKCIPVHAENNKLDLTEVFRKIGEEGVHDLWVEAGGNFFSQLVMNKLMQRSLVYVAPKILGKNALSAFALENYDFLNNVRHLSWQTIGSDVVCDITW